MLHTGLDLRQLLGVAGIQEGPGHSKGSLDVVTLFQSVREFNTM